MKNMKTLFVFLLTLVLISSVASALPVTIDKFELDDVELSTNSATLLDLERDKEYPVRIKFTPTDDLHDVEFTLFISGYDYEKIVDSTRPREYDKNTTYTERMTLALPSDIELYADDDDVEDYYKLRLLVSDRNDELSVFNYKIKIDTARHKLVIEDIILSPAGQVESGRALYVNARVSNQGRMTEDDVKVVFSIPELGVKTSAYIEEIEAGEEEEIEDGTALLLPACVEEKEYLVEVTTLYDNKHEEDSASESLWIVQSKKCGMMSKPSEPVVVTPVVSESVEPVASAGKIRSALEVALLVLVGLLVVIGLIIGFSKLGSKDEF